MIKQNRLRVAIAAIVATILAAAATFVVLTGGAASADTTTDAEIFAQEMLSHWGSSLTGNSQPHSDLIAASKGETIHNSDSCNKTVRVDERLLNVLLTTLSKYNVFLDNIITGHGCDQFYHPKGMASDIGGVTDRSTGAHTNLTPGTSGDSQSLDRSFVEYLGRIAPAHSQIGQSECAGRSGASMPSDIEFFPDTCTHQHVNVQPDSPYPPSPASSGGGSAVYENGQYHVFGISPGGVLYQNTYTTKWLGWQNLGGTVTGTPAITYHDGRFDVFAISPSNGHMYQKTYSHGWGAWHSLGGIFAH